MNCFDYKGRLAVLGLQPVPRLVPCPAMQAEEVFES